jgi:hypothetical protein
MSQLLHTIFKRTESSSDRARAKFLSRVFGIFSEQIVSIWTVDERAPYQNLGRPTIKTDDGRRPHTLDFALRERSTGKVYVSEMKCEIEYHNFRYFVLERVEQLKHHKKRAFEAFLRAARPSPGQSVYIGGKSLPTSGAILIWGAVTPGGRNTTIVSKGFHDVLSIDKICRDLALWKCARYAALIEQHQKWCNELFSGLLEGGVS